MMAALGRPTRRICEIKQALASAEALKTDIVEKTEWKWARTDEVQGALKTKSATLRSAAKSIALADMLMSNTEIAQVPRGKWR